MIADLSYLFSSNNPILGFNNIQCLIVHKKGLYLYRAFFRITYKVDHKCCGIYNNDTVLYLLWKELYEKGTLGETHTKSWVFLIP